MKPFVFVVVTVAALGGLLFGYDIGGSGGTFIMDGFRNQMGWPLEETPAWVSDEQGWISALFGLGALTGAIPSGTMCDKFGRKPTLMFLCVWFTIGAIFQAATSGIGLLYAGRFISGMAIGALSMSVTVYQSELAPPHIRGRLTTMFQLCITFGIVLAAAMNVALETTEWGWRISYGGNGVFAVLMFSLMIFMPESPRWLVEKGRTNEAKAVLYTIRQDEEVNWELDMIEQNIREERSIGNGAWSEVFSNTNTMNYRVFVGVGLQFLQQFTGINVIMFFAPAILSDFLSKREAMLSNLALSTVNFLATFIAIGLIDKVGRVKLLTWGGLGMMVFTGLTALMASDAFDYKNDGVVGALIVVFAAFYVINFAYSWGPVVWVCCSEIFPQQLRGKSMSLTTTANWGTNFIIGRFTPVVYRDENLGLWGTFLVFSGFCFLMTIFVQLYVPETKGKSLEEVDALFYNYPNAKLCGAPVAVRAADKDQKIIETKNTEMEGL